MSDEPKTESDASYTPYMCKSDTHISKSDALQSRSGVFKVQIKCPPNQVGYAQSEFGASNPVGCSSSMGRLSLKLSRWPHNLSKSLKIQVKFSPPIRSPTSANANMQNALNPSWMSTDWVWMPQNLSWVPQTSFLYPSNRPTASSLQAKVVWIYKGSSSNIK